MLKPKITLKRVAIEKINGEDMKKLALIVTVMVTALALISCSLSTEELAQQVQSHIEEKLNPEGITVSSFMLTKKGGNEYSGILETKEPGGKFTYSVDVIYDGEYFKWEIVN